MTQVETITTHPYFCCPVTGEPLHLEDGRLINQSGSQSYAIVNNVPILLPDPRSATEYAKSSERMMREYSLNNPSSLVERFKRWNARDYSGHESRHAMESIFRGDGLYLSIGGGPLRSHPQLVNVNIGPFPNVDVVADAHSLPYQDGSVDGIHCVAVLEHLRDPRLAVREMFRVLRPGAMVFAATPFLQPYHGYPFHFQGFTLTGHVALFESEDFHVIKSGVQVGPTHVIYQLGHTYLREYFPRVIGIPCRAAWLLLGCLFRPLDRILNRKSNAYVTASTTYLLAVKPYGSAALS